MTRECCCQPKPRCSDADKPTDAVFVQLLVHALMSATSTVKVFCDMQLRTLNSTANETVVQSML